MVTGFTGGTGVASYQPYLNQMSQFNTAAEGLADPSQDYQAFMSPYQQEIINTTMADFDRQAQIGRASGSRMHTLLELSVVLDKVLQKLNINLVQIEIEQHY